MAKQTRALLAMDVTGSKRTIDDNGYMHVSLTPISKAQVSPYLGKELEGWEEQKLEPDRIYYGLRDPDELKKAAPTFNGMPLLLNHHEMDANVQPKEFVVGSTGTDAEFDAPYLMNSLSITDADAVQRVQDGTMKELSCCYFFTADFTPGTYKENGQNVPYDFVMRNIRGNHVALVEQGRAGHDVAVADELKEELKKRGKLKVQKKMTKKAKDAALEKMKAAMAADSKKAIDEIITATLPDVDEETKAKFKETLENVAEQIAEVTTQELTGDEEPAEQAKDEPIIPSPADVGDDLEVQMQDPIFRAGFEAGKATAVQQAAGAISEPTPTLSQDSIEKIKQQIANDTKQHYRALSAAATKVRPLVGNIADPLAFDSADDIFAFALKHCGKNADKYNKAAYAGMVDMLLEARPSYPVGDAAMSGDLDEDVAKTMSLLDNIR